MSPEEMAVLIHGDAQAWVAPANQTSVDMALPDASIVRGRLASDGRIWTTKQELRRVRLLRLLRHAVWGVVGFGSGAAVVAFIWR
ncbi:MULTISPECIES: hypothetical protein [unclassified Burkholderia]|uniref:hypothetical protein n=1 Tax=unclassified Burkholderia TaxID=2613784 RepID=UPI002AB2B768|nr:MULTISPECIES: hypothetical protein [unclassified Burkholderia]